jgi:hypothetical protein
MLNAKKLGFAGGILGGLTMLIITFFSITNDYGTAWLELMKSIYPGYTISEIGCIVGMVYGFIDGFVFFYLLGWIYSKIKI